eukprot:symbB.v1.2.003659.t1/scaffold175.1/size369221/15
MRDDTYQTHLEIAARRQHHGIHSEIQRHLRLLHLLAPVLAVLSGILHAYGMALRKRHGNDASNAQYWMQPGWWIGLLMDALGGLAFTLAAPLMAVELLVPLTAVSQLAAAFLCGCCIFQERSTVMQQVGFVMSVTAVALLGGASLQQNHFHMAAAHNSIARFWKMWLKPYVLWTHVICLCSTVVCFFGISHATGFAVLSAYFDGMQFIFTRTIAVIVESASKVNGELLAHLSVGKAVCAIAAIHWQQQALGEDLTSIGSVLPLLQNLTQASLGATFFGDELHVTPALVAAMALSPLGVWLLAQTPTRRNSIQRPSLPDDKG